MLWEGKWEGERKWEGGGVGERGERNRVDAFSKKNLSSFFLLSFSSFFFLFFFFFLKLKGHLKAKSKRGYGSEVWEEKRQQAEKGEDDEKIKQKIKQKSNKNQTKMNENPKKMGNFEYDSCHDDELTSVCLIVPLEILWSVVPRSDNNEKEGGKISDSKKNTDQK